MSVPSPMREPPSASNAALPPLDSSGEWVRTCGFFVAPKMADWVSNERRVMGTVVLTNGAAPESRNSRTRADSVDLGFQSLVSLPNKSHNLRQQRYP